MLLPLSMALRPLSSLQVQVRRRSGRARVEEQAFRLTAPGVVEMLTAEQAAALQQNADAQQAAGEPDRSIWAAAQHLLLEKKCVCGVPAYIAVHLAAQLSWQAETTPQFPDRQHTSSEVHLAGVQVRRQCHLQTWLHHPPRTCLVA